MTRVSRWALFALTLFAVSAYADVAVLGTPTSEQGNSATAAVSNTVASGSDVVANICVSAGGGATISSMENFGGVAPVLVGSNDSIHLYRVVSPSAGATTAQANLSASVIWSIHVQVFQGVDTADPDDTPVNNSNSEQTSLSVTVSSAAGDLALACGLMIANTIAPFDGATLSTEEEALDGGFVSTALVYEAGAASVTLGVTWTENSFGDNVIIGTNINAAAGGGGSSAPTKFHHYRQMKK